MVKMIYRTLAIAPFGTNCYIVGSNQTHDGMVIDPAGDAVKILQNIKELELQISIIVLTHTHPDHIGAVGQIKEFTGAIFALHSAEAGTIQQYDFTSWAAYDPAFKPPPLPDRLLQDGDIIKVGDLSFQVLHTPGHSSGGICIAGYGAVFSGDTLFQFGIGRTDGPGGSYETLIANIKAKLLTLPDETIVLPGHGPKTTIGKERAGNPFLN
jgi:hydroxyacylglutathione hydrolase